jgi:recombinational DNA repair protein RecT
LQPLNTQLDAKLLKGKLKKNMMTVKQVKEKKEKSKKVAKGKKEW